MSDVALEKPTGEIYRLRHDRLFDDVLAGVAESQDWDITSTRMVYIVLPCVGSMLSWEIGTGSLILYLLAWLVLPDDEYTSNDGARGSNPAGKENKQ